jgi:ADP-ribose pyrophosphatase YjhB (NUDIX family)
MPHDLPRIAVAAVIERDGHYLVVEEEDLGRPVFNQPSGHLEHGESLIDGVLREVLEETGWDFTPEALTGIYRLALPARSTTFVRVCFCGRVLRHHPERPLDAGIRAAHWLSRHALEAAGPERLRSPLVLAAIADYEAGRRFPLALLRDFP